MHRTTERSYGAVAMLLHWMVALAVSGMVVLGLVMTRDDIGIDLKFGLFQLHKSIGVTIFMVMIVRLVWRWRAPPPDLPAVTPGWQLRAAGISHISLYTLLLLLPLAGWASVSAANIRIPTVLFGVVTLPHIGYLEHHPERRLLAGFTRDIHFYLAWTMVAVVAVHATAAIYHHTVLKDGLLWRMVPRRRRRE